MKSIFEQVLFLSVSLAFFGALIWIINTYLEILSLGVSS